MFNDGVLGRLIGSSRLVNKIASLGGRFHIAQRCDVVPTGRMLAGIWSEREERKVCDAVACSLEASQLMRGPIPTRRACSLSER